MTYVNPGGEYVKHHGLPQGLDDVLRYAAFLRSEAGLSDKPPINLTKIYQQFDIPKPQRADLPGQQGLLLNPDTGQFVINQNDVATRQRFTEAHELMELLFSQMPGGGGWAARSNGHFKRGEKEALCNRGAAELLMPRSTFLSWIEEQGVSIDTADQLARKFFVSNMAALVNMARVGPGLHWVALWTHGLTPAQAQAKSKREQDSLFGHPGQDPPAKRLRVKWAYGSEGTPYLAPGTPIDEDSSIYQAWKTKADTEGEDQIEVGHFAGVCRCENRSQKVEGKQAVLSLIHLPGDRGCSGAIRIDEDDELPF